MNISNAQSSNLSLRGHPRGPAGRVRIK